jgi:hypothetical protein
MFKDAMLVGSLRGQDSFGCMFSSVTEKEHGHVVLRKYPAPAYTLYGTPIFDEIERFAKAGRVVIGHHRAKTTGVISTAAAHPYTVYSDKAKRSVTGVHNGSLISWTMNQNGRNFETDSEYLFHEIAEKGPVEALRNVRGAYAVVFTMSDSPGKIFVARNEQRPLSWARSSDGKAVVFCSEYQMLDWLTSRTQYSIPLDDKLVAKGGGAWADFTALKLYQFKLSDLSTFEELEDLTPPAPKASSHTPMIYGVGSRSGGAGSGTYQGNKILTDSRLKTLQATYPKASFDELEEATQFNCLGHVVRIRVEDIKMVNDKIKKVRGIVVSPHTELQDLVINLREPDDKWLPFFRRKKEYSFTVVVHGLHVRTDKKTGSAEFVVVGHNPLSAIPDPIETPLPEMSELLG